MVQTLYCVQMPKQERIVNPPARRYGETLGIAVIVGAVIWFYGYLATSHSATPFTFDRGPSDYYHYLVDGFLHGRLSFMVKPPAALASLPDPYDPLARVRIGQPGWADVSYYHGRYYLYFGVAPAVTLFLPFKLLTGLYFPEFLACVVFCAGGYLASLALFLSWRRRYFPECPTGMVWLGTLMLGLGNFVVVMLSRSQFYEVPISGAYAFSCTGLLLLDCALFREPRRQIWLWLASAAFGLAVASRPHFVFASAVLGLAWLYLASELSRHRPAGWVRRMAVDGVALLLPLGLTLLGLFLYNYERFDSPFEFGQKYQLGGSNVMHMTLMAWSSVPLNFYYYFLAPAHFVRYFPFVDIIGPYPGKIPGIYYGIEDPFGVLTNMPCFWLALFAPLAWLAYYRRNRVLGWMLLFCGVCFGTVCLFTLFFVSATNRYMVDFLPALLLIAAVGLLMVSVAATGSPIRRFILRAGTGLLILATAGFNVMAAFQHNGLFQQLQPQAYDRLGRWFNYPIGTWDRLTHVPFGPVELTVKFSRQALGRTEPLLVTGVSSGRADDLYVYYVGEGLVQLGFAHLGAGTAGVSSQPIAVDYDVPHRIGIEAGSLYPVRTHPYFSLWPEARIDAVKKTLRVTVDGVPYLDVPAVFYEAPPGFVHFGENPLSDYAGRKFTGSLLEVRRQPFPPAIEPFRGGGFLRLAFVLPTGRAAGREPLVATGGAGAGDLLFIRYDDDTHVRLGFIHAGSAAILSEPMTVVPGQIQLLDVSLGSFYAASPPAGDLRHALVAKFNNRLVWAQEQAFYAATSPVLGANAWQSGDCAPVFTGKMVAVHPMASLLAAAASQPFVFDPYWLEAGQEPAYGALRLHVNLPPGQASHFEPLLVSGPTVSQADYVWIQYLDAARIQIGYEHTGGGGPASGAIPVDYGREHVIEIDVPSLYPHQDDPYFADWPLLQAFARKSHGQIRVDGVVRIDAPVKAYESTPAQSTPGENHLSTTFGVKFTGQITAIERAIRRPPAGFDDQSGPLEITLRWPSILPVGQKELLLATGRGNSRDALLIHYDDPNHAHLIVQIHDGKPLEGSPMRISGGGGSQFKILWGGFFPEKARPQNVPPDAWLARGKTFAIETAESPVFTGQGDFTLQEPQTVVLGSVSDSTAGFSGIIRSVRRLPPAKP
jgi:hypothetical protein